MPNRTKEKIMQYLTLDPETTTDTLHNLFLAEHQWARILDTKSANALYTRLERARAIPQEDFHMIYTTCCQRWEGNYRIESTTGQGVSYTVHRKNGCSCPDSQGQAPFGQCKHRLALWMGINMAKINRQRKTPPAHTTKPAGFSGNKEDNQLVTTILHERVE